MSAASAGQASAAATFTVNSTGTGRDAKPGNGVCATSTGVCTLRASIHEANALPGADTILVPAGTYAISAPAGQPNDILTGDLDILHALTINGAGASKTIIDAGGHDRVFEVHTSSGSVTITDVTIRGGAHADSGAGIMNTGGGSVTIARSLILDNSTAKFGGGAANLQGGMLRLADGTRLSGNSAGEAGSALANFSNGTIEIVDSTVTANSSPLGGAAISNTGVSSNAGTVRLLRATVTDNRAGGGGDAGGGISNTGDGSVSVDASTIAGNHAAGSGGGIASTGRGTVEVMSSVISGNSSESDGGGISSFGEGTLTVASSDVSSNLAVDEGGGIHSALKSGLTVIESTISGNSAQVGGGLYTSGEGDVTLTSITVSDNGAVDGAGIAANGAAASALAVERVVLSANVAAGDGGGLIIEGGPATIADSDFIANSAASGGGLANHSGGVVSVSRSSFTDNRAQDQGGGIDNRSDGTFTVTQSQVSDNHAAQGGGLASNSDAAFIIENSTISGNTASVEGGGLVVLDPVSVVSTTIANNGAPAGGGVHKVGDSRLVVTNTIIANNPGGNCGFEAGTLPIESEGGNLDSGSACGLIQPTDISGADPQLGPLADNGGGTKTHALGPTSAAIDQAVAPTCPQADQRGVPRPQNAGCDIGAYEVDDNVDPPSCTARGTVTVVATADSWINQADPAKSFPTDSALKVRSAASGNARALVRFELPTAPAGCMVLAATLRLNAGGDTDGRMLDAVRLASSWTEAGVTWSNQPLTVGDAATTTSGKGTVQWAVTSHVREMYAGQNRGFLIRDSLENDKAEQSFKSREAGTDPPQLVITFG